VPPRPLLHPKRPQVLPEWAERPTRGHPPLREQPASPPEAARQERRALLWALPPFRWRISRLAGLPVAAFPQDRWAFSRGYARLPEAASPHVAHNSSSLYTKRYFLTHAAQQRNGFRHISADFSAAPRDSRVRTCSLPRLVGAGVFSLEQTTPINEPGLDLETHFKGRNYTHSSAPLR